MDSALVTNDVGEFAVERYGPAGTAQYVHSTQMVGGWSSAVRHRHGLLDFRMRQVGADLPSFI
jgi:hypothetical protein